MLQGEKIYRAALKDPNSLARVVPAEDKVECKEALYVAAQAYETKTGRDDFSFFVPGTAPDLVGDLGDWDDGNGDMDEQKAAQLYPRLWRKFMAAD